MKILIFGMFLCLSSLAFSEEPEAKLEKIDSVTITPDSRFYPEGVSSRGVQGIVLLKADLSPEGNFKNVTVFESSRSEELDKAAIELSPKLKYTLSVGAAGGMPSSVIAPVEFRKDSSKTILEKQCFEFNLDVSYFKNTFPEKQPTEMQIFKLSTGLIGINLKLDKQIIFAKNINKIKEVTIAECAKSPELKFIDVMRDITAKNI